MTIVKYNNRKLYSLTLHRYLTLIEVAQFVKLGTKIEIKDRKTNQDVTVDTLKRALIKTAISIAQLEQLIRTAA